MIPRWKFDAPVGAPTPTPETDKVYIKTPAPTTKTITPLDKATITVTPSDPRQADLLDIARLFFPPALLFGIGRTPVGVTPPPTVTTVGTPEVIKKLGLLTPTPTPTTPTLPQLGGIGEAFTKAEGIIDKIMLVAVILSVVGLGSKVLGFLGGNK